MACQCLRPLRCLHPMSCCPTMTPPRSLGCPRHAGPRRPPPSRHRPHRRFGHCREPFRRSGGGGASNVKPPPRPLVLCLTTKARRRMSDYARARSLITARRTASREGRRASQRTARGSYQSGRRVPGRRVHSSKLRETQVELAAEGLVEAGRTLPLPAFPRAIVSSPARGCGAARHLTTLRRRSP